MRPRIPARSFFSGLVGANGNGGTGDDYHVSFELVAIPLVTALVFRSRGDPVNRPSRQSTTEHQSSEQRHLACRKHHSGAQFQKTLNALLAVTGLNDRVNGNLCDPVSKLERSGYELRTQTNHGNEVLHLGNVHIWSVNDGTDALSACYTGTDFSHHDVEDT